MAPQDKHRRANQWADLSIRAAPAGLHFLLFLFLLFLMVGARAAEPELDVGTSTKESESLTRYFAVLEDPSRTLTLADVIKPSIGAKFKADQAPTAALSFGFTRSAYWLRLTLKNTGDRPLERFLEISHSLLTDVQFSQPSPGDDGAASYQTIATGFGAPFATRAYPHRFFVFPLTLPAASTQVLYLRIQSTDAIAIPARLWEPAAFHAYERSDSVGQAWYFGMVTAIALFNLLLFVSLRDRLYLIYLAFVASSAVALAARNGLAHQLLWPEATLWSDISHFVGYTLAVASLVSFSRAMLETPKRLPRIDRLLSVLFAIVMLTPIGFVVSLQTFAEPAALLYIVTLSLVLAAGLMSAFKGQRSAYVFVAAFAFLIVGGIVTALKSFGVFPTNVLTTNGLQFGSALEMILLAFALADRFNEIRREKALAEASVLRARSEALLAENKTLAALADAQAAHTETLLAQAQLSQSEKMATLGQLIAGVTHEINTPIGAVKSSGQNITEALHSALTKLPTLFHVLDAHSLDLFFALINRANASMPVLSSREERAARRALTARLEQEGVGNASEKAEVLVRFNIGVGEQSGLTDILPLLRHPECEHILATAHDMAAVIHSANNINIAVDQAAKIILALKSFSRVNQAAVPVQASLRESLETVLTIYQGQIKRGVDLVREYEEIAPLRCLPDELNQVWTNLIHNALQAMNHQGTLTVGIRRIGNDAVVSVGDSGCGIPEAIRDKIFDVFFTTKPVGVGSGLGLDIVNKIIDKHNGRIDVRSEVGVGTTFIISLPYPALTV